jgi:hypothetical protein
MTSTPSVLTAAGVLPRSGCGALLPGPDAAASRDGFACGGPIREPSRSQRLPQWPGESAAIQQYHEASKAGTPQSERGSRGPEGRLEVSIKRHAAPRNHAAQLNMGCRPPFRFRSGRRARGPRTPAEPAWPASPLRWALPACPMPRAIALRQQPRRPRANGIRLVSASRLGSGDSDPPRNPDPPRDSDPDSRRTSCAARSVSAARRGRAACRCDCPP